MLGLQRRIVLEDNLGEKHAHYLLETIEECYFVILSPCEAERVAELQARPDGGLDEALVILADHVAVIGVRDHVFLPFGEVPAVLARSRHHVLVLAGTRMASLPAAPATEELSPLAFMDEYRKRMRW